MISNQTLTKDGIGVESLLIVCIRILTTSKKDGQRHDFVMFAIDENCPSDDVMGEIHDHGISGLKGSIYLLSQSYFKAEYDSHPLRKRFELNIPGSFGVNILEEIVRLSYEYDFVAGIVYTQKESFHYTWLKELRRTSDGARLTFLEFLSDDGQEEKDE